MTNAIRSRFAGNVVCKLLGTELPFVQAGMVWVSGGKLAAAASEAGVLGLVGAGSMKPELLRNHIRKARSLTTKPFGVNVPLLYHDVENQLEVVVEEGVKILFTSAGSPKKYTRFLKEKGCTVVHVASTPDLALKCQEAGVDAVVVEGFEAGGHNGRDELTTLVLLQQLLGRLSVPLIAAGGFGTGASLAAAFALGAQGVQMGTVFAATQESSAHPAFKEAMTRASTTSTFLRLKKHVPVRLLENAFARSIADAEARGASREELEALLGKGRARKGMLEGDLEQGELEVGQIVSEIEDVPTCQELVDRLLVQYSQATARIP
ncbi:MAG: nitronate monooxygenase [Silvanigrellales bacterium]|nr:nitronate monooxygenase [Silvanigrellales bacterium]